VLNKLTSVTLVAALMVVLSGTSAFASNSSNNDGRTDTLNVSSEAPAKKESNKEQLKGSISKLVSDAKAGKVSMAPKSQIQPAKSNGWSKGTKIAVGVGVAAAVIVTLLIVSPAFNDGQ
jgi:hypothetical protein